MSFGEQIRELGPESELEGQTDPILASYSANDFKISLPLIRGQIVR